MTDITGGVTVTGLGEPLSNLPADYPHATSGLPTAVIDPLVGFWFWWDSADSVMRRIYHGQVAAQLDGGFYLLRFDDVEKLPGGVHEIVHLERMARETWSFFAQEAELRKALDE